MRHFSNKDDFNPFSVGLDQSKGKTGKSTLSKLMSYFRKDKGLMGSKSQEIDPKKGVKEGETVNDKY